MAVAVLNAPIGPKRYSWNNQSMVFAHRFTETLSADGLTVVTNAIEVPAALRVVIVVQNKSGGNRTAVAYKVVSSQTQATATVGDGADVSGLLAGSIPLLLADDAEGIVVLDRGQARYVWVEINREAATASTYETAIIPLEG